MRVPVAALSECRTTRIKAVRIARERANGRTSERASSEYANGVEREKKLYGNTHTATEKRFHAGPGKLVLGKIGVCILMGLRCTFRTRARSQSINAKRKRRAALFDVTTTMVMWMI